MQLVFPNAYHPLDNSAFEQLRLSVLESCSTCRTWFLCRIKFKPLIQTLYFAIHSAPWISYCLLRAQSCCPILGLLTEGVVIVFTAEPFCLLRSSWWATKRAKRLSQVPIHSIKVDLSMLCLCLLHSRSVWQMYVLCM